MTEGDSEQGAGIFELGSREKPYTIPTGDVETIISNARILADKKAEPVFFEFHQRVFRMESGYDWEMVQGKGGEEEDKLAVGQMKEWVTKVKQEEQEKPVIKTPTPVPLVSRVKNFLKRGQ